MIPRVVARWDEHFQKLLYVPGDRDHEALDNITQRITKTSLDEIPGDNLFSRRHQLITNAWEVSSVPQAWKDASIVTIYKKGDRTEYGNYRGISLISTEGKIFARILLNRLSSIYPHNTRGSSGDTVWLQR